MRRTREDSSSFCDRRLSVEAAEMEPDANKEIDIVHYVYPKYLQEREFPKWTKEDTVKAHKYHIQVRGFDCVCLCGGQRSHACCSDRYHYL